jgi:hypothetical protein
MNGPITRQDPHDRNNVSLPEEVRDLNGCRLADFDLLLTQSRRCADDPTGNFQHGSEKEELSRILHVDGPSKIACAFSASGLTKRSMSFVTRGCAWKETA